jgi:hypothetical protein
MLYLGTTVLILFDLSYLSRFWTQFEAWLSMQYATPNGLKSAVGTKYARYHIVCIQNAAAQAELYTKALVDTWANETPQQAHDILSKPDVTVTNQSDKRDQLPKIKALDATVQGAFQAVSAQLHDAEKGQYEPRRASTPPPPGLKLKGGSLPGAAAKYMGGYRLGRHVNGRPAYQHVADSSCWIAFGGDGWMGQPESSLGEGKGSLDLRDSAAASPDVSTKTWKASGGVGSGWVEAPQLKCTAWTPPQPTAGPCLAIWKRFQNLFPLRSFFSRKIRDRIKRIEKEKVEQAIKELRSQGWDDAPSFYFLPAEWVRECDTKSLPRMQTLRDDGVLKKMNIPLGDAFQGKGVINHILFVSHRWELPSQPDPDGVQLEAIKAYLEENPDIEWIWFDYSTMPQRIDGINDRTPMEKAEFQLMLAAIADLFLTARVLILPDGSYASRFWTLMEAWCSMQTATPEGLRPATEAERRYTISCIHNADFYHDAMGLVDRVSIRTPEEMFNALEKPDVNVTNAKDKEIMLPKILEIDRHIIETFRKLMILPTF